MEREIAVFRGDDGFTATLGEPGRLTVFRRLLGQWEIAREVELFLDARKGLRELRRKLAAMLSFLGECRIFVAGEVSGVPYFELGKAGFKVWEYPGEPAQFLEDIWTQAEEDTESRLEAAVAVGPAETAAGHYAISLKEIQANNAGISSKQALLPFVRRGNFRVLEVICSHTPPWLEQEILNGRFTAKKEELGPSEIKLTIVNQLSIN